MGLVTLGMFIWVVKFFHDVLSKLPDPPPPDATTTPLYDRHYIPPDIFDVADRSGQKIGDRSGLVNEIFGKRTTAKRKRTTRYYPWISRLPPVPPNPPKLTPPKRRTTMATVFSATTMKYNYNMDLEKLKTTKPTTPKIRWLRKI